MNEEQRRFIWLAHAELKSFAEIEKELNVSRKTISQWENDLRPLWQKIAAIKRLHLQKGVTVDFKTFYEWFQSVEEDKKCCYCGITESEIEALLDSKRVETKRLRGRKLELDRKEPNESYDKFDNIVYACYWCNNAKTDTFTHEEFLEIGKVIANIWKQRMQNDPRFPNQ